MRAHGIVTGVLVDGSTYYEAYNPFQDPYMNPVPDRVSRPVPGNGPIEDITSDEYVTRSWPYPLELISWQSPLQWRQERQPCRDRRCWLVHRHAVDCLARLAQGPSHYLHGSGPRERGCQDLGPYGVRSSFHLSPIPCTDGFLSAVWFKVDEAGLEDGKWAATDIMIANNNTWTWQVPSDLAAGNYLVRHEMCVPFDLT